MCCCRWCFTPALRKNRVCSPSTMWWTASAKNWWCGIRTCSGRKPPTAPARCCANWDAIKRQTKGGKTQADLLQSVPRTLPALMRAAKVQNRARRVGFDWPDVSGALEALDSETAELKEAIAGGDAAMVEEELGDLLFPPSMCPVSLKPTRSRH